MKELTKIDPVIVSYIIEQMSTQKKLAVVRKPKGQVFEYNKENGNLVLAEVESSDNKGMNPRLNTKPNMIYVCALNHENATRKLLSKKIWFHTFNLVK